MNKKKIRPARQGRGIRGAIVVVLALGVAGGLYLASRRQQSDAAKATSTVVEGSSTRAESAAVPAAEPQVPPYHKSAEEAKPFPRLLPATYFRSHPVVARAYQIASEIPGVIAQQPCYCYCDKFGHRSLLDCYASDHGAG